jgi:hypothetical protein
MSFVTMNRRINLLPVATSAPVNYAFNGVDGSYDTKVTLYPVPDAVYTVKFSLAIPQATLAADATVVLVSASLTSMVVWVHAKVFQESIHLVVI